MRAPPDQADIFAAHALPAHLPASMAPAPAAPAWQDALMPARPRRWLDLLARATHRAITVEVCTAWSGIVVEVLSDPALGRHHLHQDGVIAPFCNGATHGRQVWFTQHAARALHRRHPLVLVAQRDAWSASFRLADPGDVPDDAALGVIDGLAQPLPPRPQLLAEARHDAGRTPC